MKKKLIALLLCMVCIVACCAPAYARTSYDTLKDEDNNVSYSISYEDYLYDGTGSYFMASISNKENITARKGQSPSGKVTFLLRCRGKDDRYVHAELSWGGADTDCTKKYTASFKSTYNKVDVPVTITREATSGHTWGSTWSMVSGSTTKHERSCTHPVCVQKDTCEAAWTSCTSNGNGTHTFTCEEGHTVTTPCSGGEATCVAEAVCKDCHEEYGSINPDNHKEKTAATCVAKATCELCGNEYGSVNPENHLPGEEATCTTDQVCTRVGCGKVLVDALGHDESGAEATCTTDKVCAREGCDHVLVKALGHELEETKKVAATCTEKGYIDYICTREGCGETVHKELKAKGHWYDLWTSNEDGTHSASCKRENCKHIGKAECALWEVTETKDDIATILNVCPVCGDFDEKTFEVIAEAKIDCEKLPMGEAIVRGMEAPFEGALYAFTAGYEYSGKMQAFENVKDEEILPITISLPLSEEIGEFTLVRVDVTPATEEIERAEVWTELAYTFEDGVLTFETETDGLFLLLPVTTEEA